MSKIITNFKLYPNLDEELLEKFYQENNYIIEETNSSENLAVIYFSSNGIYYPDDDEHIIKEICNKNRYEWYKLRIYRARKHIFVRDILKQFYCEGINNRLNSIDKVIEFLAKETQGMQIITIGSSAGGYMALVAGIKLNAKMIFASSPFFDLVDSHRRMWLPHREDYRNIVDLIEQSNSFILYFTPVYSTTDIEQFELLTEKQKEKLHIFKYKSDIHGGLMKRKGVKGLINSSPQFLSFVNKYIFKGKPHKKLMQLIFGLHWVYNIFDNCFKHISSLHES